MNLFFWPQHASSEPHHVARLEIEEGDVPSQTWRFLLKILRAFNSCKCSDLARLIVVYKPHFLLQPHSLTADEIFQKLNDADQDKVGEDQNLEKYIPMTHEERKRCVCCNIYYPMYHVHGSLRFLELVHCGLGWSCIGNKFVYSGWVTLHAAEPYQQKVLFQIDLKHQSASYVQAAVYVNAQGKEMNRHVFEHVGLPKGLALLFSSSQHRPFPSLLALALEHVLASKSLYCQLPKHLQLRFSEIHNWPLYFKGNSVCFFKKLSSFALFSFHCELPKRN